MQVACENMLRSVAAFCVVVRGPRAIQMNARGPADGDRAHPIRGTWPAWHPDPPGRPSWPAAPDRARPACPALAVMLSLVAVRTCPRECSVSPGPVAPRLSRRAEARGLGRRTDPAYGPLTCRYERRKGQPDRGVSAHSPGTAWDPATAARARARFGPGRGARFPGRRPALGARPFRDFPLAWTLWGSHLRSEWDRRKEGERDREMGKAGKSRRQEQGRGWRRRDQRENAPGAALRSSPGMDGAGEA